MMRMVEEIKKIDMNKNTKESCDYAKYRTFCILSEEMIREYGRAVWMEKADKLYEKVKQKIMELPIAEAEQQMKQVDIFFQNILEGKSVTVETKFQGTGSGKSTMNQTGSASATSKATGNTMQTTTQKTPLRPRLKLTGNCPVCKKKTYLQFTNGYFCPSCNALRVEGAMDSKKKDLQARMQKVLFDYKTSPEKTIHELEEMLVLDEHCAQLYGRLGLAYRQMGDNKTAMQYYEKAAELDDRDGVIYSNIGVLFVLQHDYTQATSVFQKAYECWEQGNYTDWKPEVMFANYAIALHKKAEWFKAYGFLKKAYEYGYGNCEAVFENWGVGKEICKYEVERLMNAYSYSANCKQDKATLQKVKKHFSLTDEKQIYYFYDYTVLGSCKEGLAVCEDGIYFKMMGSNITVIKWYEIGSYEFSLLNEKNIIAKKKEKDGSFSASTIYFLQKQDGVNFLNILRQMQK